MIRLLTISIILTSTNALIAQENNYDTEVNKLFELKVESIEQKVTLNKWGTDTLYYLHFRVKNISHDMLTFITNTCFYYNHSALTIGNLELDINAKGGCYFNSYNYYKLAPGESFSEAQWITGFNLNKMQIGEWNTTLTVPLIKDDSTRYRVDGRGILENQQSLIFEGKASVYRTLTDNTARKKKKKKAAIKPKANNTCTNFIN